MAGDLYTKDEVLERLDMSERLFDQYMLEGDGPDPVEHSGVTHYTEDSVDQFEQMLNHMRSFAEW